MLRRTSIIFKPLNKKFNLAKTIFSYFYRDYSTEPELTKIRFPNIRRGNYNSLTSEHVNFFKSILGKDRVLSDATEIQHYNTDFAQHVRGVSEVVLKPKTTEEVSTLLKFCYDNNLAVCPQGGNSGLVLGSTPVHDEVIISTGLMNRIIHLDEFSGALTCQSGCILEVLENYLEPYGLIMPIDLGAKGTCHIGGNLSTNAGGIRLLRYGNLHGSVLGLEVVLANGEIIDLLSTVKKDNTGYHLKNLFIGAEGTLGIITKVVIQCPAQSRSVSLAFLGLDTFENVLASFKEARMNLGEVLSACEFMDNKSYERSVHIFKSQEPLPLDHKFYLLIETRSSFDDKDSDRLSSFVEKLIEKNLIVDAVVASEPHKVKTMWEIRHKVSLAFFKSGYMYKYDVSLPLHNFYKLVEVMQERLQGTSVKFVAGFGHLGDGNLHLNICSESFDRDVKNRIEPFVFEKTHEFKGSISAEHGIGLEKSSYLHLSKSSPSINLMKDIKNLLDPKGILNPYKVFAP